jgi:rhodanese-related sulfurtransferase
MKRKIHCFMSATICWLVLSAFLTIAFAADSPRITKEELQAMLGNPDLIIIDDRAGADWTASEFKIKGAIREDPANVEAWMDKYPRDKTLVFYCA